MADPQPSSFTGRSRKRTTRPSVKVIDKIARSLITFGGIGTILSVLGVAVFLIYVVLPLFLSADTSDLKTFELSGDDLLGVGVDEYQVLGWMLKDSGDLDLFRLDTGEVLSSEPLFSDAASAEDFETVDAETAENDVAEDGAPVETEVSATEAPVETAEGETVDPAPAAGPSITAPSFLIQSDTAAFGMSDGSVRIVDLGFKTRIYNADDLPSEVTAPFETDYETTVAYRKGVVRTTPSGQYRLQELDVVPGQTTELATGPIEQLTHVLGGGGATMVFFADGRLQVAFWTLEENMMTGESSLELDEVADLPVEAGFKPDFVALSGAATEVLAATTDGELTRINLRNGDLFVAEKGRLVAPGVTDRITFFRPLLGGTTYLWGDSAGRVEGGFTVRPEDAEGEVPGLYESNKNPQAQQVFARTKSLADAPAAATAFASSSRSRLAYTGFDNGELRLFNITNATEIQRFRLPVRETIHKIVISPKENGVLAVTSGGLYHANLDPRYPEASFSAFFRPVWYEGYADPQHTWQSSSGTDDFEMKLGLMPLIFGTLKATFYSMLFGAPLALLAAIFTSEFLPRNVRGVLKPGIEFMASLPSVVLGFLAALVFAPYVEKVVPAALGLFVTLPVTLLLGAFLWQMLPSDRAIRWQNWRFLGMVVLVPVGIALAGLIGPTLERLFFAGDIKGWLAWNPGDPNAEQFAAATGGWMILGVPLAALVVTFCMGRFVSPRMRIWGASWSRNEYARFDLLRFVAGVVATLGTAFVFSWLMSTFGFDPRGAYVDTYVQRNSLIVGFVMGFAIIPIIFTISEDALSTVPQHLRSASLGAGATQWQTATRIVIPTAMSGLFSALMIGLGRAVGETMIVLMAAGNTPVMEMNIFEGFRTLSANIAVELPEAVKGDTHYRTLFLAALVLFVMTFVVNTVAEVIRQRFRKRAYQL